MLHGAFGVHVGDPANARRVVVEFSAEKTELVVGRVWHPTQELKRVAGGRTRLSFTCTNLLPVVSWILQWGPHATVIEPDELTTIVIDELERARAQYPALGVAIRDKKEIEARAAEARNGGRGIAWDKVKRDVLK